MLSKISIEVYDPMKKIRYGILIILCTVTMYSCEDTHKGKTQPDVIFATTPHRVVKEMLKLAEVTKEDVVYDLGSGDGRIVIAAARDFGARGVGIEIDPKLIIESNENARSAGVSDRITFIEKDIFVADTSQATVVALYMLPELNKELLPKLFKELRPGTRIVSHKFGIGDWQPDMTLTAHDTKVLFWIVPANVTGDWRISLWNEKVKRNYTLTLNQHYQKISGTLSYDNRRLNTGDMKLYGTEIMIFVSDTMSGQRFLMTLEGIVSGDTMEGKALVTEGGGPLSTAYSWKGIRIPK